MSDERIEDGLVPEGENEQFTLPDGTLVGTGMLRVAGGPPAVLRAFPQDLMLDDRDIERRLKARKIEVMRNKRRYRMRNQGRIGSCCPVSVCSGFEQLQENTGRPHVPLQPEHLYSAINGGSDGGALLDHAMKRMVSHGCASAESGLVRFETVRRSQIANVAAADKDGLRFRLHEPYELPTDWRDWCRAVASAICHDLPVEIAWHVTGATMAGLRNGFCQVGNGPGNHASLLHWAQWVGGDELIVADLQNSWGPTMNTIYGPKTVGWGDGGFGLIRMSDVFATRRYHRHFVSTMIIDDPKEFAA